MNKIVIVGFVIVALVVLGVIIVLQRQVATQNTTMQRTGGEGMQVQQNSTAASSPTETVRLQQSIPLTIASPANASIVTTSTLAVKGKTTPKAEVFVNDKETIADSNGNFSVTLTLDEGDNPIVVLANDENGNEAEQELSVTYEVSQ